MTKALFLRRGYGFTQDEIANKLGISRKTLRRKEEGESDFTKTEMEKITELFKQRDPTLTVSKIFFD